MELPFEIGEYCAIDWPDENAGPPRGWVWGYRIGPGEFVVVVRFKNADGGNVFCDVGCNWLRAIPQEK